MKKSIAIFASIITMAISANVMAQNTDDATATASATIILPISIEKDQDLSFGTIASTTEAGWVMVDADGDITSENDNQLTGLSTHSAASFTISGEPNALYSITLPTSLELVSGGNSMEVDQFTMNLEGDVNGNFTINNGGEVELTVGATLNVNALQEAGDYTGEFDVTVDYN